MAILANTIGSSAAGSYALALAVTTPIFIVLGLGLRTVVLTLNLAFNSEDVVIVRTLATLAAFALAAIAAFVVPNSEPALVIAVATAKSVESYYDASFALMQRAGRYRTISSTSLVNSFGYVAAAALAALSGASPANIVLCAAASSAAVFVLFVKAKTLRRLDVDRVGGSPGVPTNAWATRLRLVRAGVPAGVSAGTIALLVALPQIYLGVFVDTVSVGQYAIATYVLVATELVLNARAQAWISHARLLTLKSQFTFATTIRFARGLSIQQVFLAACAVIGAWNLIPMMFGPDFALLPAHLPPLLVSLMALPSVFALTTALNVRNRYTANLYNSSASLVLCAILGPLLIPSMGVAGALWVNCICLVVRVILPAVALRCARTD